MSMPVGVNALASQPRGSAELRFLGDVVGIRHHDDRVGGQVASVAGQRGEATSSELAAGAVTQRSVRSRGDTAERETLPERVGLSVTGDRGRGRRWGG